MPYFQGRPISDMFLILAQLVYLEALTVTWTETIILQLLFLIFFAIFVVNCYLLILLIKTIRFENFILKSVKIDHS